MINETGRFQKGIDLCHATDEGKRLHHTAVSVGFTETFVRVNVLVIEVRVSPINFTQMTVLKAQRQLTS